jgi:hypothetical protein
MSRYLKPRASKANHHAQGVDGQQQQLRNMVGEDADIIFFQVPFTLKCPAHAD